MRTFVLPEDITGEMIESYYQRNKEVNPSHINSVGFYQLYSPHFERWVHLEQIIRSGENLPKGIVPGVTLLYVEDQCILGYLGIRFGLNEFLFNQGGHIGYSVHPDYRNQGIATLMLNYAIDCLHKHGIDNILVTCHEENVGSRKTIEKCGGIYENTFINKKSNENILRYWIGEKND